MPYSYSVGVRDYLFMNSAEISRYCRGIAGDVIHVEPDTNASSQFVLIARTFVCKKSFTYFYGTKIVNVCA